MSTTRRLWTCQDPSVLEALVRDGELRVDPWERNREDGRYPYSYQWLAERLPRVIPGYAGGLPWWFHVQRPAGSDSGRNLLMEFEVPRDRAFVMPCWAWHQVFLGHFLPVTSAEWKRYQRECRRVRRRFGLDESDRPGWLDSAGDVLSRRRDLPAPLRELDARCEASFERLFEPGALPRSSPRALQRYWGYRQRRATSEAVVPVLKLGWLRWAKDSSGRTVVSEDAARG